MAYLDTPDHLNTPGHVFGIDVSKWNRVDWGTVPSIVKFVIIKASQRDFIDSMLRQHYDGATGAGLPVGFYHYLDPKTDAHAQAEMLLRATEGLDVHPLLGHWLDYEEREISAEAALGFLEVMEGAGVPCGVYTAPRIMRDAKQATADKLGRRPLWTVDYYKSMPHPEHSPDLPRGWGSWRFWQWGSHNPLQEMRDWHPKDLDCNFYAGRVEDFEAAGGNQPLPPPAPLVDVEAALGYNRRQAHSRDLLARVIQHAGATTWDEREAVRALARYQDEKGLDADGKLGPETRAALESECGC